MTVDLGAWIGLIALVLAIPLGVASISVYNWLMRTLERRRLVKANETKEQAIRAYKRIRGFRIGTKDKYAYYLMTVGWAIISGMISCAASVVIILMPETPTDIPDLVQLILLLTVVGGAVCAVLLLVSLYGIERRLENFEAYQAEVIDQWGPLEE